MEYQDSVADAPAAAKKKLCSLCMGAFEETALVEVDGQHYCSQCRARKSRAPVHAPQASPRPDDWGAPPAPGDLHGSDYRLPAKKHRGLLVTAMVVVVLLGAGIILDVPSIFARDRIDRLLSGVDGGRDDAVEIIHRFNAGEVLRYQIALGMNMNASMDLPAGAMPAGIGDGGDVSIDMTLSGMMELDVLSVDEHGNARLRASFAGFSQDAGMKVNGKDVAKFPKQGESDIGGQVWELEVDRHGAMCSRPVAQEGSMDPEQLGDFISGKLNQVPHRALKIGETWTLHESLPGTSGMGLPGFAPCATVTYTVAGFKKFAGRDCLVISLEGNAAGDGSSSPASMDLDLDLDLKGAIFYDPEAKRLVKSAIDMVVEMSMSAGEMSADYSGKIRFDMDLL